jgi:FAD/FMN-containing dehydrogenase
LRVTHVASIQIYFANQHDIPFLAVSGGHGAVTSLARINQGIEIWLSQMNSVSIAPDGNTATFGGGVSSKEVTDALWAVKKQTGKHKEEPSLALLYLSRY